MLWYRIKIGSVYLLLMAGGGWHVFGIFQSTMQSLASFMMATLCILQVWEYLRFQNDKQKKIYFFLWTLFVYTISFAIEWIGVTTGAVFGHYEYSSLLQPIVYNVPLVIGLAWLGISTGSITLARYVLGTYFRHRWLAAGLSAVFMTLFDFLMEPAAMKLNYWRWLSSTIPLQNYFAWFLVSLVLVMPALHLNLFGDKPPTLIVHVYTAQLLYFLIVYAA